MIVVGAGPVGIRIVQELHRRAPALPIVLYGEEPSEPYNRVRLSAFLSGEADWRALTRDLKLPDDRNIEVRFGCAVTEIDCEARRVRDATGAACFYSHLVLATGSRPHVPDIPGIRVPGVYTFRDISDAQKLLARRVRSRRTVVLGGGLLGLEAARAMQRFNTEVCVVEHYARLMMRQLDERAAGHLLQHVKALGIEVILNDGARRVLGEAAVAGVQLRSERTIACDTVLVATGIRPAVELARGAGLHVGRGIRVDDRMLTSDPHIYAVGECAEHRGRVYGIVAPGFEQAAVVAHTIAGGKANYRGSIMAARLKVLDLPVFSIGTATEEELPDFGREWRYGQGSLYRKLVTWRGELVGAVTVGDSEDLGRLQEAVLRRRRVWPWQLWRFLRTGSLWPRTERTSVATWPATATVCNCTGVTRGALAAAIAGGCTTTETVSARTGAATVCGSCRPLLAELIGSVGALVPARGAYVVLGGAVAALLGALAIALFAMPYAESVQLAWQWDVMWRDSFWKQTSGFTVMGLAAVALLLSLRKRMRRFAWGEFPLWRALHVLLGALTLAALAVHTGGRLGSNLNRGLMVSFLVLVVLGAAAGAVIALEHRLGARAAALRRTWLWGHILLFWPIPLLLTLHVLKTYYF